MARHYGAAEFNGGLAGSSGLRVSNKAPVTGSLAAGSVLAREMQLSGSETPPGVPEKAGPETADDGAERLSRLEAELGKRRRPEPSEEKAGERPQGWGFVVRVSSDFVAGILVGAGVGYLLDHFAGTGPWGLIVFLLLGFAAGVINVMRTLGMVAEPEKRNVPRDGSQQ